MTRNLLLAATAALAISAGHASAAVVLSDNFNASGPPTVNWPGDAVFTSTGGALASVDLIGSPGNFYDLEPGNGYYVDLDGSTGNGNDPAGQLTSVLSFGPGSYSLSFFLAGNNRVSTTQSTTVSLGDFSTTITPGAFDGFSAFNFNFSTATSGNLIFTENGPSNQQGNLLDNVTLTAVPEPATWGLMILGFGAIGLAIRSKRHRGVAVATI